MRSEHLRPLTDARIERLIAEDRARIEVRCWKILSSGDTCRMPVDEHCPKTACHCALMHHAPQP